MTVATSERSYSAAVGTMHVELAINASLHRLDLDPTR
jgi:hypothetical protein